MSCETAYAFIVVGMLNVCIITSHPIHDFRLRTVYAIRAFVEVRWCTLPAVEDVLGDLRAHRRPPVRHTRQHAAEEYMAVFFAFGFHVADPFGVQYTLRKHDAPV
jgi:hypothetical protein